jgi:hypothetical protein
MTRGPAGIIARANSCTDLHGPLRVHHRVRRGRPRRAGVISLTGPGPGHHPAAPYLCVFRSPAIWMFTFAQGRERGSLPRSGSRVPSPVLPPWAGLPGGPGPQS